MILNGYVLEVDYQISNDAGCIRLTFCEDSGERYELFDTEFKPYFYVIPGRGVGKENIGGVHAIDANGGVIRYEAVEETKKVFGKNTIAYRIIVNNPSDVPKLSSAFRMKGTCYETDIPFARRYLIDKSIVPLSHYRIEAEEKEGVLSIKSLEPHPQDRDAALNVLCFDIETYNPLGISRPAKDPVLMISYSYVLGDGRKGIGVITYKKVDRDFVELADDEKDMFRRFTSKLDELKIDILTGYASTNFDIKYMFDRAKALKINLKLERFEGGARIERHGLVDRVKISGRVHIDMFLVSRFVAMVGAQESILKLNSYTLKNVYEAISKDKKVMVEKGKIYEMWDAGGEELERLTDYNLNDAVALQKVYDTFIPIMFALTKVSGDAISDVAVSTASQLVEFMMMRSAFQFNELIPNKPSEHDMRERVMTQFEGAFVKTPEPGIYSNILVLDYRGLYPSIIISHNVDPSAICTDCDSYYQSPTGTKFSKEGSYIMPTLLKKMVDERLEIKKAYKKDPSNIVLGAKSQALKIIANAFYGYLGYSRARWYSRECASSVTAFGREYIINTMTEAEKAGFKVIYGDTDSLFLLMGDKKKEEALAFLKKINGTLPPAMELEVDDFYRRGVFVSKKIEKGTRGAKKKYALISESGKIKIRGFELVRRDWSKIAQNIQRQVLETILNEGDEKKAAELVKDVVKRLNEGRVPLEELIIRTQLRKSIDSYDGKSPEIGAAKAAVEAGFKKKSELEHGMIEYIITKEGDTISDRARIYGMAKDYDADYYINHQVLPATMRILKELNFDEDELRNIGKQKKL